MAKLSNDELLEAFKEMTSNIFDDIAGNRRMHQLLPTLKGVARDVYANKLATEPDMTTIPRHLQMVYSLLRESMIGDGDTQISDEVAQAIEGLRHFGAGDEDAIEYVTNPNVPAGKRWKVLQKVVWPVYESLLKKDLEDKKNQPQDQQQNQQNSSGGDSQQSQGGDQSGQNQAGDQSGESSDESESGEQGDQSESGQGQGGQGDESGDDQGGQQGDNGQSGSGQGKPGKGHAHGKGGRATEAGDTFSEDYEEYWKTHPEILTEEQEKQVEDMIKDMIESGQAEVTQEAQDEQQPAKKSEAQKGGRGGSGAGAPGQEEAIKALEAETGVSYEVIQQYREMLGKVWPVIEDLERFFEAIIGERLTVTNRTRRYLDEGTVNSEQLADAVANVMAGQDEGAIYQDTATEVQIAPDGGGFDFFLGIDTSGSMGQSGGSGSTTKAQLATETVVALIEGLASCHQKVLEAQAAFGVELGLDVATSVMLFGDDVRIVKSSGELLSEPERMAIFTKTQQSGGGTGDYLAMEAIHDDVLQRNANINLLARRKIVIMVSDGGSSDPDRAKRAIDELRSQGVVVIGVGIGSDASERMYSPDGKQITDATQLPDMLLDIIKQQIASGTLRRNPQQQ